MKRLLDIVFALGLLLVASPLMLLAVIGIKLTSPGPLFYGAKRVGKNGKEFVMLKFRSMRHVSDRGEVITKPSDNRIFPFGKFLRASKLDELPQLLNIVKGEMSFVGPRPEDPLIVKEDYAEWMMETLDVLPGLTSPGTIAFMKEFQDHAEIEDFRKHYAETILPRKLDLDLDYVRYGTVWDDLKLIAETGVLVSKKIATMSNKE